MLAALALRSADAAARVARLRAARLPAGASAAFRAEENRFWHETLAAVRGRIDWAGGGPPVA